jgi:predicted nucleic acid-binding protein
MRVYLDLCCLKRPFDLQEQPIVRLQTEAVLSILSLPQDTVELLRSKALLLENSLNPNQARREAVSVWLAEAVAVTPDEADLAVRIAQLVAKGFKSFDAFHLASAELGDAATFLTVDRQLLKLAGRVSGELHVPVTDPVHFIEEVSQWKH